MGLGAATGFHASARIDRLSCLDRLAGLSCLCRIARLPCFHWLLHLNLDRQAPLPQPVCQIPAYQPATGSRASAGVTGLLMIPGIVLWVGVLRLEPYAPGTGYRQLCSSSGALSSCSFVLAGLTAFLLLCRGDRSAPVPWVRPGGRRPAAEAALRGGGSVTRAPTPASRSPGCSLWRTPVTIVTRTSVSSDTWTQSLP